VIVLSPARGDRLRSAQALIVLSPFAQRSAFRAEWRGLALFSLVAVWLAGCAALFRNPVPPELTAKATIPDMPDVRAWAGQVSPAMERDFEQSFRQESPADFPPGADGVVPYAHLALSGGGANGAFGAGFLKGWSRTGSRPVFKIVTGVSTGAVMAPFAFLGPQYDDALREFYTTTTTRDIFDIGSLLSILIAVLRGDSLADTGPLAALIERHVDAGFLRQVADAHNRGRRLYIGTVDLDSQQFVVWNMGLIASSGRPKALDLFRQVILASASVPIAFPPVLFDVEAGGQRYDEMQVDGAVAATVFLHGGVFRPSLIRERAGLGAGREDIFVIHNGQLRGDPSPTPRSLRGITARVLEASSRAGVVGALFIIYGFAQREQASFQWVTIPQGVEIPGTAVFDPAKMTELYEVGYRTALAEPVWYVDPPLLQEYPSPP
jgi:predicted acylesterase/phospholipase RssA